MNPAKIFEFWCKVNAFEGKTTEFKKKYKKDFYEYGEEWWDKGLREYWIKFNKKRIKCPQCLAETKEE